MEFLRGCNWIYFQVGKYNLSENWYEIRIAFDFCTRHICFSFSKVFKERKKQ